MISDGLILPCRDCGKAIAVVKVGGLLAYGHLVNPTFMHHEAKPPTVRLARSADRSLPVMSAGSGHPIRVSDVPTSRDAADLSSERTAPLAAMPNPRSGIGQPHREGSATRREDAPNAGPSYPRTTNGKRAASNGSAGSRVSPSRTSNPQRRARRTEGSPPGPLDPRPSLSAGALDRRG